jgi:hypothetical protein
VSHSRLDKLAGNLSREPTRHQNRNHACLTTRAPELHRACRS